MKNHGGSSAVYGLGFIGALFYFLQHATTFGLGVMGVIKALLWPAFIIYQTLTFFKIPNNF